MDYAKVKSVSKDIRFRGKALNAEVVATMKDISDIVGATLGPGGAPVLIERQDFGMPNLVTKDGVTVFRSLGFRDPAKHAIMESARDAAVRTVGEAGDGTTTATVLAYALVKYSQAYAAENPDVSPQSIVRDIQAAFDDKVEPLIRKWSKKVNFSSKQGKRLLRSVATISANGDTKLADAVMSAYDLVGDQGTVTIIESSGPYGYKVEKVEGYPVPIGFEDSCGKFMNVFVNDAGNHRVHLRAPYFILYNGTIGDVQTLVGLLDRLQAAFNNRPGTPDHNPEQPALTSPNFVLIANGFTEAVLATLATVWQQANVINVLPVVTPRSPVQNGEVHFLDDVAAITGATVLNPLSKPFDSVSEGLVELGRVEVKSGDETVPGEFEMLRFRSTIVGRNDDDEVMDRADVLESMAENAISELDSRLIRERLAALTGGIAKLTVVGSSNGELRERKDRADDAVRAVQGAIKLGCLPGGGWTLLRLAKTLSTDENVPESVKKVLVPALYYPVQKLLMNIGMGPEAYAEVAQALLAKMSLPFTTVYNAATREYVDAFKAGVLDSTPAVLEALRSSISIATLLGTLGGVVVFERDRELERREASANQDFLRNANTNEANERW